MAQDALDRFWWPSLMMFGPTMGSAHSAQSMKWKIKRQTNDELRQKFVDQSVRQAEVIGLTIPRSGAQVERSARSLRLRRDRLG